MFDEIDATGSGDKRDPRMRNVEAEMIRSHELCLKLSARKPTDPDYKSLLEELFQCEIDDSVAIVSPFYCDCGCRMTIGRNITINKGATILSPGRVVIEDNVLIGPEVKIATVDHDLYDRHNLEPWSRRMCQTMWWSAATPPASSRRSCRKNDAEDSFRILGAHDSGPLVRREKNPDILASLGNISYLCPVK